MGLIKLKIKKVGEDKWAIQKLLFGKIWVGFATYRDYGTKSRKPMYFKTLDKAEKILDIINK